MRVCGLRLLLVAAVATAGMTGLAAAPALAAGNAPMNVSFQASDGNSAGWVTGHQQAYLTVASSDPSGFAIITLHHFASALPTDVPTYDVSGYAAGTPRIYVQMSSGDYIFIYPDSVYGAGIVEAHPSFAIEPYSDFVSAENGLSATVTGVFIVADASQATPYTATVNSFQYGDTTLIGN